jgi:hypothetical protein
VSRDSAAAAGVGAGAGAPGAGCAAAGGIGEGGAADVAAPDRPPVFAWWSGRGGADGDAEDGEGGGGLDAERLGLAAGSWEAVMHNSALIGAYLRSARAPGVSAETPRAASCWHSV